MEATNGRFYTIGDVQMILGTSRSTVERMVKRGEFPKPTRIGSRVKFWIAEVEEWLRSKAAK